MDTLGIWPTPDPEHPAGSPHPPTASQLPGPDSSLPLHRNGREGADQQPRGWWGLDTGSPASLVLGEGTYCCGPRRGQYPRSRPHSQCLRYLHCCLLGMCPERRRACPCLVLRVLCCGQGKFISKARKTWEWNGRCSLFFKPPESNKSFGKQRLLEFQIQKPSQAWQWFNWCRLDLAMVVMRVHALSKGDAGQIFCQILFLKRIQ